MENQITQDQSLHLGTVVKELQMCIELPGKEYPTQEKPVVHENKMRPAFKAI